MFRLTSLALGFLLTLIVPAALGAQVVEDETRDRFLFGPLGLTPRIALKDVGFDTNPRNQPGVDDRDFTFTLEPGLDSSLRIGRGRLSGKTTVEWLYYDEASSERSFNFNQEARAELTLNRIRPYAFGAFLRTRQRPTPEIDQRVQQNTVNAGAGTRLYLGSRLRLDLEGRRTQFEFGEGEHGDAVVASALNRDSDAGTLIGRFVLTPLTTFLVRSELQQDRFEFSPVRDNDSLLLMPGFELKPSALISGLVMVGMRRLDARDETVPDYTGVVAQVDAQHVVRDSMQLNLRVERDVVYSIETEQPYYVQNGGTLSVLQTLGLNWYVVGRLGETRLNYRDFLPAASAAAGVSPSRRDRVQLRGVGIGRRIGQDLRVGFDLNYVRRRSTLASSEYEGYRVGGSISYGIQTR